MHHATDRAERTIDHDEVLRSIRSLIEQDDDLISVMANVSALLFHHFGWHWVGFYRVQNDELVLGPFQGPVACSRIARGKGVCGTAWEQNKTLLVPDVDAFPGHIACSPHSRSEVVVPVNDGKGNVVAVLDVDSSEPSGLTEQDARTLERIAAWVGERAA